MQKWLNVKICLKKKFEFGKCQFGFSFSTDRINVVTLRKFFVHASVVGIYCIIHSSLFLLVPPENCPSGHMMLIQRRLNVDATSWRCIDVETTLYIRHVSAKVLRKSNCDFLGIHLYFSQFLDDNDKKFHYRYRQCMQNMIFHTMSFP